MKKRIFIVDDDIDHAESLADMLEMRGHEVELAESGEEALARFAETDFDLVLMDVKLPGMNGVETFFAFRRLRPEAHVLMMTGFGVEQLIAQAIENGALGVLHKPFSAADLLEAIENVKPRGLVLVADDDVTFAQSLTTILSAAGYRVEVASTGQEAFEKSASRAIDCMILDMRMPVLSGLEVYLRLQEEGRHIPTILVTGFAADQDTQNLSLMTQGLLVKPFDPSALLRAIAGAMDIAEAA
jgi:CheY-like chemotaxis protein